MIKKIAHLADIHIYSKIDRHEEYVNVFEKTYQSLKKEKPDRIVIVGDLFHDFINISNEAKTIAGEFLNRLSEIAKVIITQGNHDIRKSNIKRLDSVKAVVKLINNKNIYYFDSTGFFQDENIVWAVWHHSDKLSPWVNDEEHIKDDKLTYIDLFHDPINGCKLYNGQDMNSDHYVSINDFKGDYGFFGDIHKRQLFNKDNILFGGYCSSLIQQNYGETPEKHGYLLWDIENRKVEEIDIDNDFVFINFYLKGEIDYDNILIDLDVKDNTKLKVHWEDYSSNITSNNERKIRSYLRDKYPQIIEFKWNKKRIDVDNKKDQIIDERIKNINNITVQHEIFKEILKEKKYDDDFIDEVIKLDIKITDRLTNLSPNENHYWQLLHLNIDNFKAYGENNILDLTNNNGLYQISSKNKEGKSSIYSSIQYLLYGKTLETLKKEKNGDNRFINNKREEDYCQVEGIFDIDGRLIKAVRRTERNWSRGKDKITSCPTTLTIEEIDNEGNIITNETDEGRKATEKLFHDTIGSFDDMLRTSLITADSINNLLSMDESVFIDNILRDSGLDIFEKKLEEYKKYKKETYTSKSKIVINVEDEEQKIITNIELIESNKEKIQILIDETNKLNEKIINNTSLKEDELKKLHKIDTNISTLNPEDIRIETSKLINEKTEKENEIVNLDNLIKELKDTYNIEQYDKLLTERDSIKEKLNEIKYLNKDKVSEIDKEKYKISVLNGDMEILRREISNLKDQKNNYETNIKNDINNINNTIGSYNINITNEINNINNQITQINFNIEKLEDSKKCSRCDLVIPSSETVEIDNQINKLKEDIITLENNNKIQELNIKINKLTESINNASGIIEIDNQINDKINLGVSKKAEIPLIEETIKSIENEILYNEKTHENLSIELEQKGELISQLELDKQEVEKREKLLLEKNNIPLYIENINLKIKNKNEILEKYELTQLHIKENEKIQKKIDEYQSILNQLRTDVTIKENDTYNTKNYINELEKINNEIKNTIDEYKKQEREELINKVYQDCIHRDGVPRRLLLRMRNTINNEIFKLLSNMDFTLFFDEDMSLKFYNNVNPEGIINAIGSSGAERTFSSLALRLALRNINNNSINDFILIDEIMGTLVDDSVVNFVELLEKIKEQINKVFIIEHAYSDIINADYIITPIKNELGISKFTIEK